MAVSMAVAEIDSMEEENCVVFWGVWRGGCLGVGVYD